MYGYYHRSGRMLLKPHSIVHPKVDDEVLDDEVNGTTLAEFKKQGDLGQKNAEVEQSSKLESSIDLGQEKEKYMEAPLTKIPSTPPSFPHRLKKKEEYRFSKFMVMLKQLSKNVPLVEALKQIPSMLNL